jgi:CRP/FNR family cyclic AMP-dependent transcriptional regulator
MATHYLEERTYETGDTIFVEGDIGSEMFIVLEGMVVVTKNVSGSEVYLATIERGDFFGEMAVLNSEPRQATCRAVKPTRLLAIRSGELLVKLRRDPTFAVEMLQKMSTRIRYLDEQLLGLMERERLSRQQVAKLQAKGEYPAALDQR